MKKIFAVLIVLSIFFTLSACKGKELPEKAGGDSLAVSGLDPLPRTDDPIHTGDDLAGSPFIGNFINSYSAFGGAIASEVYAETEIPKITISDKGDFTLSVYIASLEKTIEMKGVVEVDGETAALTVESRSQTEFLGAEVEEFSLTLISEKELRYSGDQIGPLITGDLFEAE